MFTEIIKFSHRRKDLDSFPDFWQSDTYNHRIDKVFKFIKKTTGFPPKKNIRPVREGVFEILPETTITELLELAKTIKQRFVIDCFQCSIDRQSNTAHMLFDMYDRQHTKCVWLNPYQLISISVLIIRTLHLPRPAGSELWLRPILSSEYEDDPKVFDNILGYIKRSKLTSRQLQITTDVFAYVKQVCRGVVRNTIPLDLHN